MRDRRRRERSLLGEEDPEDRLLQLRRVVQAVDAVVPQTLEQLGCGSASGSAPRSGSRLCR